MVGLGWVVGGVGNRDLTGAAIGLADQRQARGAVRIGQNIRGHAEIGIVDRRRKPGKRGRRRSIADVDRLPVLRYLP